MQITKQTNLGTEVVKFQREVEQKASHIGGAVCQVLVMAPAQPSYYKAGNELACPLGKTGSWHQEHMQQHLIAVPPPQTRLPEHKHSTCTVASTRACSIVRVGRRGECVVKTGCTRSEKLPADIKQTPKFAWYKNFSMHMLWLTRQNPPGINFLTQRVRMPGLAGVPVARGAPHAAMLCQQTALMPSICSVTYIKCMLLSLSPQ